MGPATHPGLLGLLPHLQISTCTSLPCNPQAQSTVVSISRSGADDVQMYMMPPPNTVQPFMQRKSKHPKTQFSAPSLGDGLELKEIILLRKKKAINGFRQRNPPCRWDPLQVLLEVPFRWLQCHHTQEALLGLGLSRGQSDNLAGRDNWEEGVWRAASMCGWQLREKKTKSHPKTCLYL